MPGAEEQVGLLLDLYLTDVFRDRLATNPPTRQCAQTPEQ